MSTPWYQGSQPLVQNNGYYQHPVQQPPVQRRNTNPNPPPVCFNCGVEGHFLVACPEATRTTPGGFAPTPRPYQQFPSPNLQSQPYAPQAGHIQQPPYQPTPQYGNAEQQYPYNSPQTQQPYGQPQQYAQPGFQSSLQPSAYGQHPPHGPPQFSALNYQSSPQQFAPLAPVPYQQPLNPYQLQSIPYGGAYQAPPAPYQPPQAPQNHWNNTPSATRQPYQQQQHHNQQRRGSSQRGRSGTPSNHMQRQRSRSQQVDHSSESIHPTPQTPASIQGSANQVSCLGSLIIPDAKPEDDSKASSRASTPYGHYGSVDNAPLYDLNTMQIASVGQDRITDKPGDSELGQVNDRALFNWEFKHIFKEPAGDQTVALAQPLSANFKSTPVPLVQAWSMDVPSISRYARKDNLKEFVCPIRELPQWSYLQEDPAFSDLKEDSTSVSLEDLPYWAFAHHEEVDMQTNEEVLDESLDDTHNEPTDFSRKRGRSEEAEEPREDHQCQANSDTVAIESLGDRDDRSPRTKRLKNETEGDEDEMMQTPTVRTPVIGCRSGTPCIETEGDAWAPEPGESASNPQDPTEALLASLGVTGSPKPVKKEPVPAYMNNLEEQPRRSQSSQPPVDTQQTPHPPAISPQNSVPPITQSLPPKVQHVYHTNNASGHSLNSQNGPTVHHQNGPHLNNQQGPPMKSQNGLQMKINMNNSQGPSINNHSPSQFGPPANAQYTNEQPGAALPPGNFQQGHLQYGPPANLLYQNGAPHNYGSSQYGQPAIGPYSNGQAPQNNYGPPQQGLSQWAPPQHQPYNNLHPANAPQGYDPYPQQNGPYGNSQYVTNAPYQNPSGPYHYPGPPQYDQQQISSFGNGQPMHGTYGSTQSSPTQYPPQNGRFGQNVYPNGVPQPQQNQSSTASYSNTHGAPNSIHIPNGQPQQPFRGPHESVPRQDSGHMSARGSYSIGTSSQRFNSNHGHPVPPMQSTMDGASSPKPEKPLHVTDNTPNQQMTRKISDTGSGATDSTGTPLSPTSMEILGKLERRSSGAKSGDKKKAKDAARKFKRPQPVVAEAYSRRW